MEDVNDSEDTTVEEKEAAAEDLIEAVAEKDAEATVDAFEALYELCRKG